MVNLNEMLVKFSENFVSIKRLMSLEERRVRTISIFVCLSRQSIQSQQSLVI